MIRFKSAIGLATRLARAFRKQSRNKLLTVVGLLLTICLIVDILFFAPSDDDVELTVAPIYPVDHEILGTLIPDRKYVVLPTLTDWSGGDALQSLFLTPLIAAAWKRVGYESVVVAIGRYNNWQLDNVLCFVLSCLRRLGSVVVLLDVQYNETVRIATKQVSPALVAFLFSNYRVTVDDISDVHVTTNNALWWPTIEPSIPGRPTTNSCALISIIRADFSRGAGDTYRRPPKSSVGTTLRTWSRVFHRSERNIDDLLGYLVVHADVLTRDPDGGDAFVNNAIIDSMRQNDDNGCVKVVSRKVTGCGVERIEWPATELENTTSNAIQIRIDEIWTQFDAQIDRGCFRNASMVAEFRRYRKNFADRATQETGLETSRFCTVWDRTLYDEDSA